MAKRKIIKERDEKLIKYMEEHSVQEAAEHFNLSEGYIYVLLRHYGVKHHLKYTRGYIHEERRRDIDIEHLKKHAKDYTCLDYFQTFNPPCARVTLYNRAKELGVKFKKKSQPEENPFILDKAKELSETMSISDFYNKYKDMIGMSFSKFGRFCKNNDIKFIRKHRGIAYTDEEIKIVRQYYPIIGSECYKYLLNRTKNSVSSYAYRHGLFMKKPYDTNKRNKRGQHDHLGKTYQSIKEMCRAYDISLYMFYYRRRKGWELKDILTRPRQSHDQKIPAASRYSVRQKNTGLQIIYDKQGRIRGYKRA